MGRGKSLHLERYSNELPKENRLYGGNNFYVDLVPGSVWWAANSILKCMRTSRPNTPAS